MKTLAKKSKEQPMNISDDLKRILEGYTKGRYGFLCEYAH